MKRRREREGKEGNKRLIDVIDRQKSTRKEEIQKKKGKKKGREILRT